MITKIEDDDIEYSPIEFCDKCGQVIIPESILLKAKQELEQRRKWNKENMKRTRLRKKMAKEVKPLTEEEINNIKTKSI